MYRFSVKSQLQNMHKKLQAKDALHEYCWVCPIFRVLGIFLSLSIL